MRNSVWFRDIATPPAIYMTGMSACEMEKWKHSGPSVRAANRFSVRIARAGKLNVIFLLCSYVHSRVHTKLNLYLIKVNVGIRSLSTGEGFP